MKNFKILSIFFIISILVISVGAVSAADDLDVSDGIVDAEVSADLDAIDDSSNIGDSNQDDLSIDEDVENVVIDDIQSSDESASLKEKTNILKETNGNTITVQGNTFADIQTAIDSASSGDTILLSDTYYGNGNEIKVSERNQISIIGNGYTLLDAGGLSRILKVSGSDNVIIKNLNFANGNDSRGGAVYVADSADCNIENCTFINNSAYNAEALAYGGAVYVADSADCNIENCSFINNSAYGEGEYGNAYGGAIYISDSADCIIENCSFINNSAESYIYDDEEDTYYPISAGGAVYWHGDNGLLTNCTFINNSACGATYSRGGAVYIFDYADCIIENCSFINNSACGEDDSRGGAVYVADSADCNIENCTFINNSACGESNSHGGAVYILSYADCIIENCTFINNSAYGEGEYRNSHGGAVYISNYAGCIIENCSFINNSAFGESSSVGGAVYWYGDNGLLTNCTFINNSCGETDSRGGAVYWSGNNGFLNDSKFVNNSAIDGCDVFWSQYGWDDINSGTLANCYLANYNSSSIYVGEYINVINITQDKYHTLTELKNLIDAASDEITLENDYYYVFDNKSGILINKNLKINGNGHIIDGMRVSNIFNVSEGSTLAIDNVIFKQSLCVIESMGILNITNSQFIRTGIRYQGFDYDYIQGISINSLNKLYLSNCNFSEGIKDIFANGSGLIENCIFRDKVHDFSYEWYGQQTCVELYGDISLLNSEFTNIELLAINAEDDVSIKNCTFHDNKLAYGNLISLYGNVSIMDSKFINNTLYDVDGYTLISTIMSNGENEIINCDFINCSSPGFGAAISIKSNEVNNYDDEDSRWDNVLIKDCSFINCSAESGGAIAVNSCRGYDYDAEEYTKFYYSNATIVNCTFNNNKAEQKGGAIYISRDADEVYGICAVINSTFLDNQAISLGDDIYNTGNLSLSGNTLTNDFATIYNAYYSSKAMITSPVSLVILDNTTKKASVDNPFIIYAALVDDNGNLIEDDRISLEYGSTLKTVFYNNRNGLFEYTINSLSSFENETLVSGTYNGAENLNVKTGVISLKSSVEPSIVDATIDLDYLDENVIIKLKDLDGHPLSGKTILVSVNNANSTKSTDSNGEVRIQITENSTVKAVYTDDLGASVSASLVVRIIENTEEVPVPVPVSANATIDLVAGDGSVTIILKDLDGNPIVDGIVNVTVNGIGSKVITDDEGKAHVVANGNYTLMAAYADSLGASVSASIVNSEVNNTVEVPVSANATIDLSVANNVVTVVLTDLNGNVLVSGIQVYIDGSFKYNITTTDGRALIDVGENSTVKVIYVDELGASVSGTITNTVNNNTVIEYVNVTTVRTETQIVYQNMVTTAVDVSADGRVGKYFSITLKDKSGKVLANKPVSIGFNGKVYDRVTDGKGQASLQINLAKEGIYTFAIAFLGDDQYNGSFVVAKITVNKQKGSLTVPSKSYKASAASKTLTATFKSAKGNPVRGKKVSFTVNGKTYTATTNAKGVATVKVSLNKKGTYNFTAKFAGNNMYAAMTKTAKLTIK